MASRSALPAGGDNLSPGTIRSERPDLDMPVSIPCCSRRSSRRRSRRRPRRSRSRDGVSLTMPLITETIFQGIFDRFPKLRMAAVESGVG